MKIFVSWSGELSQRVALILKEWFPNVIQSLELYISSEDVDKGARWLGDVSVELERAEFGIICLTRENMNAPWILFESGAISKSINQSRVIPLLIDLPTTELKGPLLQFQASTLTEADILKLVRTVNHSLNDNKLKDNQVETAFRKWWPDLDSALKDLIEQVNLNKTKVKTSRSEREILEELLQLMRTTVRSLPKPNLIVNDLVSGAFISHMQEALEARGNPLLAVALDGIVGFSFEKNQLSLRFSADGAHLAQTILKTENLKILHEICGELTGRNIGIKVLCPVRLKNKI